MHLPDGSGCAGAKKGVRKRMGDKRYLKWYNKIGYGSGDLAANCIYGLLTSFDHVFEVCGRYHGRILRQSDRQDTHEAG